MFLAYVIFYCVHKNEKIIQLISKLYSYFRKKLYNYKIGIIGEDYC